LYLAPSLLALQQDAQQVFGAWLPQQYAPPALVTATNAPVSLEVTVLRSATADAYLVGLVNYQKELPNVPVNDLHMEVRLHDRAPVACRSVSNGAPLPFTFDHGVLHFDVPSLETIEMIEVVY